MKLLIKSSITFYLFVLFITSAQAVGTVWILDIKGAVGPATSDYVERSLNEAQEVDISLIILRMDTPGGLDTAMRAIIKAIIASPIPVVTYVAPPGARAASAGTYILYASHVAAMAPGTNLGAATPVQIGGNPFGGEEESQISDDMGEITTTAEEDDSEKTQEKSKESSQSAMSKKIVNDAEAYIRALAEMHGRNVSWAVQAVREAASLTAQEALEQQVIEIVATDIEDLLTQLEGREVKVLGKARQLSTSGLIQEVQKPDWRNRLLAVITDPNIAYILMLLGIYGLFFELAHPGSLFPGVLGGICLLLALFAFQVLPVNYAGIALILLGIALIVGEAFMPSFGILGIGGITAFVIGSIILMDSDLPGLGISRSLIAITALFTAGILTVILKMAVDTLHQSPVSGREDMLGAEGECLETDGKQIIVRVHSEHWNAHSSLPVTPGQRVRVTGMTGLILSVEPVADFQDTQP